MSQFAVFSNGGQVFNITTVPGTTTINNGMDAGSQFAGGVTELPGSPVYNGGGSEQTIGASEQADFAALASSVPAGTINANPLWATITPGNYTFTIVPTTLNLTVPGHYHFQYIGADDVLFENVIYTLDPSLSSDDVIWHIAKSVTVRDSTFAGILIADGFGINVEAISAATVFTGRALGSSDVVLRPQGNDVTFDNQITNLPVPEPSSMLMLFPALAIGAVVRRRLTR
jgi:hypothetical protein